MYTKAWCIHAELLFRSLNLMLFWHFHCRCHCCYKDPILGFWRCWNFLGSLLPGDYPRRLGAYWFLAHIISYFFRTCLLKFNFYCYPCTCYFGTNAYDIPSYTYIPGSIYLNTWKERKEQITFNKMNIFKMQLQQNRNISITSGIVSEYIHIGLWICPVFAMTLWPYSDHN